jgi:hypothetical protein
MSEKRVVEYMPTAPEHELWRGHVENHATVKPEQTWTGRTIERVIEQMNKSLAPWPDEQYLVEEKVAP